MSEVYFSKYTSKDPKRRKPLRYNAAMSVKCKGTNYLAFKGYCAAHQTNPSAMLRKLVDRFVVRNKVSEDLNAG